MVVGQAGHDVAHSGDRTDFKEEVASRFGLVPNFFQTASDAPGLIQELWGFAKAGYLDNPLPSLFKERLFVHLSRFCEVRYCIVRHVGFLVGQGHPSGDPHAMPNTLDQVVTLLKQPSIPEEAELNAAFVRLESGRLATLPDLETQAERDVFAAASILFVEPARSGRARDALKHALGGTNFEVLTAFLAFIRTAHYWTLTHPDLVFEEDMEALLRTHEELAKLLLDDPGAARCDMGKRLHDELVLLRRERDDRAMLRQALAEREEAQAHQQLLINELNHRVKNTLSIVQSLANQTLGGAQVAAPVREALTARLLALAQAHDLLTQENWAGAKLESVLAQAVGVHAADVIDRIKLDGPDVQLTPKQALSFSMAAHELSTNAAKYGALSNEGGRIEIFWSVDQMASGAWISLRWQELDGPAVSPPTKSGFGTRLVEHGLAAELQGEVCMRFEPTGLICTVNAPLPPAEDPLCAAC